MVRNAGRSSAWSCVHAGLRAPPARTACCARGGAPDYHTVWCLKTIHTLVRHAMCNCGGAPAVQGGVGLSSAAGRVVSQSSCSAKGLDPRRRAPGSSECVSCTAGESGCAGAACVQAVSPGRLARAQERRRRPPLARPRPEARAGESGEGGGGVMRPAARSTTYPASTAGPQGRQAEVWGIRRSTCLRCTPGCCMRWLSLLHQ